MKHERKRRTAQRMRAKGKSNNEIDKALGYEVKENNNA